MTSIWVALSIIAQMLPILAHGHGHAGVHEMPHLQHPFMSDDSIDVTTDNDFFGLTTYAHLPYVNCLKPDDSGPGKYDIAILGAPFDTVIKPHYYRLLNKLTDLGRASQADQVLGLDLLESAGAHNESNPEMRGTSILVNSQFPPLF